MKIIQVLLLLLFGFTARFEFEEVNLKDIEKEILNLNTKYLKKRLASIALCFSKYGTMKF